MKVFKFYSGNYHYAYSGNTEEKAKEALFEDYGEMEIDKTTEIPESEWDEKFINVWEDNDMETEPWKESIREQLFSEDPILIFTNDLDF